LRPREHKQLRTQRDLPYGGCVLIRNELATFETLYLTWQPRNPFRPWRLPPQSKWKMTKCRWLPLVIRVRTRQHHSWRTHSDQVWSAIFRGDFAGTFAVMARRSKISRLFAYICCFRVNRIERPRRPNHFPMQKVITRSEPSVYAVSVETNQFWRLFGD
jgi:hypothetical protein